MFKAITAGDQISAERKFHPEFMFRPYCRLLFSANKPPLSGDADSAFFDRWYVLPFNRIHRDTQGELPRRDLDAKLANPGS
jgi:putative DNA primase/helicase